MELREARAALDAVRAAPDAAGFVTPPEEPERLTPLIVLEETPSDQSIVTRPPAVLPRLSGGCDHSLGLDPEDDLGPVEPDEFIAFYYSEEVEETMKELHDWIRGA